MTPDFQNVFRKNYIFVYSYAIQIEVFIFEIVIGIA